MANTVTCATCGGPVRKVYRVEYGRLVVTNPDTYTVGMVRCESCLRRAADVVDVLAWQMAALALRFLVGDARQRQARRRTV